MASAKICASSRSSAARWNSGWQSSPRQVGLDPVRHHLFERLLRRRCADGGDPPTGKQFAASFTKRRTCGRTSPSLLRVLRGQDVWHVRRRAMLSSGCSTACPTTRSGISGNTKTRARKLQKWTWTKWWQQGPLRQPTGKTPTGGLLRHPLRPQLRDSKASTPGVDASNLSSALMRRRTWCTRRAKSEGALCDSGHHADQACQLR